MMMTTMNIKEISRLRQADFNRYQELLIGNQQRLLEKQKEECIFISALTADELERMLKVAQTLSPDDYPLLGVPFSVKDNIDVKGFNTTAGCPSYSYAPQASAFAVQQLEAAGAICIGKTNMDQFATGLVGTRSPYGVARNAYNPAYIPGGSSSGSASSITAGYASFSLGTDTAGSGRVPAAFQNLVGVKPTKGIVSNTGLVPACKSLDCISVFASDMQDASTVLHIIGRYDRTDEYSRENRQVQMPESLRLAIPRKEDLKFFGNAAYEAAYTAFIQALKEQEYHVEEVDFSPFFDAAKLLYNGPWVAERFHAVGAFIEDHPADVFPVTRQIILGGKHATALVYFDAEYKLRKCKRVLEEYAQRFSAFIMPTAGTIYKIEEVNEEPVLLNSNLGYYTNFMNLLDCAAIALPVAITQGNLPFGITAFAPAFNDNNLLKLGEDLRSKGLLNPSPLSSKNKYINLAVCGAHKREGSLNHQLTEINAIYRETAFTTNEYRLFALESLSPPRPGLIKDPLHGGKIEVEIWRVPAGNLGGFIDQIAAPLCFGKISLENGEQVTSFLCEDHATKGAKDITALQRWENFQGTDYHKNSID